MTESKNKKVQEILASGRYIDGDGHLWLRGEKGWYFMVDVEEATMPEEELIEEIKLRFRDSWEDSAAEVERLKELIRSMVGRLDYAVLQLEREAKFIPEWKSENARFYRGYRTVREVRDNLRESV